MEKVVIDTSVAVKWFIKEPKYREAIEILDEFEANKIAIIAPDILPLELANALYYSAKYTYAELQKASHALYSYGMKFITSTEDLLSEAITIMSRYDITVY